MHAVLSRGEIQRRAKHVVPGMECLRTAVQFRPPPPFTKIPTLIGWDFFCPERQCWRGFGYLPLERHRPCNSCFQAFSASLSLFFSATLLNIQGAKSCIGAGLRAIGLLFRLLWRARPRQRKAQKNRPEAACRRGAEVSACLPPAPHVASASSRATWAQLTPGRLACSTAPRLNSALNLRRFDMNTPHGLDRPSCKCP